MPSEMKIFYDIFAYCNRERTDRTAQTLQRPAQAPRRLISGKTWLSQGLSIQRGGKSFLHSPWFLRGLFLGQKYDESKHQVSLARK